MNFLTIKTSSHTCLSEDTLDQLVCISVEGPPLSQWNASGAISKWLSDKHRRLNQRPKELTTSAQAATQAHSSTDSDIQILDLEDWQTRMCSDNGSDTS